MSDASRARLLEAEMLEAEIEALERRREEASRDAVAARSRLQREAARHADAAARAEAEEAAFQDAGARALALEARLEQARAEAATCEEIARMAEADLSRASAAVHGLLARLATVAGVLEDDELRRFARRGLVAADNA